VNTKDVLLGVFVILTIVFASAAFIEYGQITTSTATSTTTWTHTTTTISATTQTNTITTTGTITQTSFSSVSMMFLSASGYATGPGGFMPVWGGDAYLFDCAGEAATPQGCTHQVTSTLAPYPSYVINIKYPFANQTEPSWANCLWTVQGTTPEQGYAYCVPINSTSFIVGEQSPPHL
jgi:hypothetical protein